MVQITKQLLRLTIMDALDPMFSENGIIPSKKTRRSIINASEKISNNIQQDLKEQRKNEKHKDAGKSKVALLKINKKKNSELTGNTKIKVSETI